MPTTLSDLIRWEEQKDVDKFIQILKYLDDEQFMVLRIKAIEALGRIRDKRGLLYIIGAMEDSEEKVANFAKQAACKWGKDDINVFCETIEEFYYSEDTIRHGVKIISQTPCERVSETYLFLLQRGLLAEHIRKLISRMTDFSIFIQKTRDQNLAIRYAGFSAIGNLYDNQDLNQVFIAGLCDEDVQIRCLVERNLREQVYSIETDESESFNPAPYLVYTPYLKKNLRHQDYLVRSYAISCFAAIGDSSAIDDLLLLIKDPFQFVRMNAAVAFLHIKSEKAFKPLVKQYFTEEHERTKYWLIRAISNTGHPNVFYFLRRIIDNETNFELQENAIQQLESCKHVGAFDLICKIVAEKDPKYLRAALNSLGGVNDPRSVDFVIDLLPKITDFAVFRPILYICEKYKDNRSIIPIIRFTSLNPKRIEKVANSLAKIMAPDDFEEYMNKIELPKDPAFLETLEKIKEIIRKNKAPQVEQ